MATIRAEVLIIGAGIVGLSTAVAAAYQCPGKVVCLDHQGVANTQGASGDGLRLFRLSYFEQAGYVPLLREAIEGWKSLGDDLYVPAGGLYCGLADGPLVSGSLESALHHEIDYELLEAREVRKRFPQFDIPDNYVGFLEREGGYVHSAKATRAMAEKAQRLGVNIFPDRALSIKPVGDSWLVTGESASYLVEHLVVAAGNETGKLVPTMSRYLNRETHLLTWFNSPELTDLPGFGIMDEEQEMLYGFPAVDDVPGVKVGGHYRFADSSLELQEEALVRLTGRFLPGLSREIVRRKTCDYDMSPDGHFMIGELEHNLTVACGFSGHGYKFGSVIGEVVLGSIMNEFEDDLSFLDVNRFTSKSGLT